MLGPDILNTKLQVPALGLSLESKSLRQGKISDLRRREGLGLFGSRKKLETGGQGGGNVLKLAILIFTTIIGVNYYTICIL